jgi:hypothetical protein
MQEKNKKEKEMKKIFLTLTILLSLTGIASAGCYGYKPYKPMGYCDGGQWQLICSRGQWHWICID